MSFKGTIIVKKAGHLIPVSFLERALKEFPTIVSIASVTDGKFETDGMQKDHTITDLVEWQELFKEQALVMYLAKYPDEFHDDDVPPFVLVHDQKNPDIPQLLLFTDGDFSNYRTEGSTHSPDYFAVSKYFQPKVNSWMKDGHNLEKVIAKLNDEDVRENIENSFVGAACVVFQAVNGDIIVCSRKKDDETIAYDWGFASNGLGWEPKEEKKEEPKPAEAAKPAVTGGRFRRKTPVNTEAANDRPAPKSEASDAGKAKETPAKATAGDKPKEGSYPPAVEKPSEDGHNVKVHLEVPSHLINKTERKVWFEANTEDKRVPNGFKHIKQIFRTIPQSQLVEFLEKGWKPEAGFRVSLEKKKDVTPKLVTPEMAKPAETKPAADDVYKSFSSDKEGTKVGVRSVTEQKELQAEFKTILGINSKELSVDPGNIHKLVGKYVSASEQAGQPNIAATFLLSPSDLTNLRVKYPEWYDSLVLQLREGYVKELDAAGKLKAMLAPYAQEEKADEQKEEVKIAKTSVPTSNKRGFSRKVA